MNRRGGRRKKIRGEENAGRVQTVKKEKMWGGGSTEGGRHVRVL